jgi:cullin 3
MQLFLSKILRGPIQQHLVDAVLAEVRVERDGHSIHRSDVKGTVDVFLALSENPKGDLADDGPSIYKRDLEPVLLEQTREFYKAEGERLLQTCDAPDFLARVGGSLSSL